MRTANHSSRFIEMFGDPVNNSKGWPVLTMKESSELLSDGPFGSNLKSEHYTEKGIRVIRLQNICQGYFEDTDKAFVSEEHYRLLEKYTCKPGDIVIGTLGEPNLRACVIPLTVPISINKADCVHYIPRSSLLNTTFACAYINNPGLLHIASSSLHGTTRSRIAARQVSQLPIFIPPIRLQLEYERFAKQADKSKFSDFKSRFIEMFGRIDSKKRLGDVASYINGFAFKPSDWTTSGLPIIRIQNLTGSNELFNYYNEDYPAQVEVNNGDILISWSATLGVFVWAQGKALLNQHIFKVSFDKGYVNRDYFIYAVTQKLDEMATKTHGTTMRHIVKSDFDNTVIPFPDKTEQDRFATFANQADKSKYLN